MAGSLKWNKLIWLIIAVMALAASSIGVARHDIYRNFGTGAALPAIMSQDLIAVVASIAMAFLAFRVKEGDFVQLLVLLGIVGYFFYIYGLYVIGKNYNDLYFLYMAIFALSFFSLVYSVAHNGKEAHEGILIPSIVRKVTAAFLLLIPLIFYPMWIIAMWPFMREMRVPVVNSNVYILDMCFVLPGFAAMAVMLIKGRVFAILLAPALLIMGFTLGLSVALSEFLKPLFSLAPNQPFALLFVFLTLACLSLTVLYFNKANYSTKEKRA